jgi:glycosyltransferase involved in cell wall biosynthesis
MSERILHVIPAVAPRYGGPSAATTGMCRALIDLGHTVLVATTDADGPGRLRVETDRCVLHRDVPTIFFRHGASESFKWSPGTTAWMRRHVHEFSVVHIHAVFSHAPIAAARACRMHGVPYLVRPLGTLDPWSLARHRWRKRALLSLAARTLLERAAAIHYTSAEEQRLAEQALPWLPRGVIVPLGVDDELFHEGPVGEPSEQAVLAYSRIDVKKGIDVTIAAFHALADRAALGGWKLLIAGDGQADYVAFLRRLASEGPARERIEFLGWIQPERRRALFGRARLFVLASHQENFGIAAVEAMAAGVPVLLSPGVNLVDDIVSASAGWKAERTLPAWTDALAAALNNPDELVRRGQQARAFADQYRWPAVARRLSAVYENVIARSVGTSPSTGELSLAERRG